MATRKIRKQSEKIYIYSCMIQLKKFLRKMEKVTQTASYWGTGIALLEKNHTIKLLDHMD